MKPISEPPATSASSLDATRRAARIRKVIEECMSRRAAGEMVTDASITESHHELMPELAQELAVLSLIERARVGVGSSAQLPDLHVASPLPSQSSPAQLLGFRGYDVVREIHRGGQGVVFEATQRSTGRRVAVKVLHESVLNSARDIARFDREVRILGLLSHPNLVGVIDSGAIAGRHYLVMDLIDGRPIGAFDPTGMDVRTGELNAPVKMETSPAADLPAAVRQFVKICDAVHAAHLRGIIHRDLKPSNILIDRSGEPHILDFGLAKVTESSELSGETMTAAGQFVGSLPWASPEQADGATETLDIRTDVYSLGVILFQVITGRFPYPISGGWKAVAETISRVEPARPRGIRAEIDDDLEKIVLKCLAKDPARRYQSAGELGQDLSRYLAGEPVTAKGDSAGYVLMKLASKHRVKALVAAGFLILLVGSGVAMSVMYAGQRRAAAFANEQKNKAESAQQLAELRLTDANSAREQASLEADKAQAVSDFLTNMLGAANPMKDGKDVKVADILKRSAETVGEQMAGQPLVEARIRDIIGQTYHNLGMLGESEEQLRAALAIRTNLLGEEADETCDTKINLAATLWVMGGKLEEAQVLAQAALDHFERTQGGEGDDTLSAMQLLGAVLNARGRPDEVLALKEKAYEICRRKYGENDVKTIEALGNIAFTLDRADRNDEAEQVYLQVLELSRQHLGPDSEFTSIYELSYANLIRAMGRPEEAEPFVRHALEVSRKLLPPGHPRFGDCLSELASIQASRGEYDDALQSYREALDIHIAALGADSWRTAGVRLYIVGLLVKLERYEESEKELEATFSVLEKSWGEHQPIEAGMRQVAAMLYANYQKPDKGAEWQARFAELDREAAERMQKPDPAGIEGESAPGSP